MKIHHLFQSALFLIAFSLTGLTAQAQDADDPAASWVSTWGTAPSGPNNDPGFNQSGYQGNNVFAEQTVRLIVHTSLGGKEVRVRLSNEFGTMPLKIGAVHVAVSDMAENIVPGTDRTLTFNGQEAVIIPAGAPAVSDPVAFDAPARTNLAVSMYLPGTATVSTAHVGSIQTSYVSAPNSGNVAAAEALPLAPTGALLGQWPLLTDVQVRTANTGTFVVFGSSISSGVGSTNDANHRWPDYLAKRLAARGLALGVVNASIPANKLLLDVAGPNAQARFDRDVLSRPGVKYVLVTDSAGVDIIGGVANPAISPSVDDLVGALEQIIGRAHAAGIKIFAGTILPVEGFVENADSRAKRLAINEFIRSGAFDGVADFEKVVLDPSNPFRLLPELDSGDHHHPNDEGYRQMAKTVLPLVAAAEAGQ